MKKRLYDSKWQAYRLKFLKANPYCIMCAQEGRRARATVVDHITPHRGNVPLFWDTNNHQPLCTLHHNSVKARQEESGADVPLIGLDGWPVKSG
jgi:5-methylcytosine-specific restriction protein A